MCDCEFTPDPDDPDEDTPEKAWHYLRTCPSCSKTWYGLHCPHDGRQTPCPHCGNTPMPETDVEAMVSGARAELKRWLRP